MKRSIKYIAIVALTALALEAAAWNKMGHETIAALAEQNLSPKAKAEVTKLLGGNLKSGAMWLNTLRKEEATKHTASWHHTHLDAAGRSTTTTEGDAVVQIERCANILRNASTHSRNEQVEALKTIVHLVADLHCIHHIRIEGEPLTDGFRFKYETGKKNKKSGEKIAVGINWSTIWGGRMFGHHIGFTPELMAEDMALCRAEHKEAWSQGTPREWAADMGVATRKQLEGMKPGIVITRKQFNLLDAPHEDCLAKAGWRLAALLNNIYK